MHRETLSMFDALRLMRELTTRGVAFSFSYWKSDGTIKEVRSAVLRKGYRSDQSKKSNIIIGYTDLDGDKPRQFHRALLREINQIQIIR